MVGNLCTGIQQNAKRAGTARDNLEMEHSHATSNRLLSIAHAQLACAVADQPATKVAS
jgi:hypothetical protein